MDKLEELLSICDREQRVQALMRYARSLGIDITQARNSRGTYSEERLALLIFDACHNLKTERHSNVRFLSSVVLVGSMLLALMLVMPQVARIVMRDQPLTPQAPPKTFQAYDASGRPVSESGQPVLFELMDGAYQQFDKEGRLQYEFLYKDGNLISRREFNKRGEIIRERLFDSQEPSAGVNATGSPP